MILLTILFWHCLGSALGITLGYVAVHLLHKHYPDSF